MIIYRGSDIILEVQADGIEYKNLNTHEHTISFKFELIDKINFEKGDSVYLGKRFSLDRDCIPIINKLTNGFVYNLMFYDEVERWGNFIVKYAGDTDFELTTPGTNHLKLIVDNIKASESTKITSVVFRNVDYSTIMFGSFTSVELTDLTSDIIGEDEANDIPYLGVNDVKSVIYKDLNILEALDLIAETYGLEWWFDGALHLGVLKTNVNNPTKLEYDVELDDISFSESSEARTTRLYAFGGTRNMPYNKRLKLDAPIDAFEGLDLLPRRIIEGVRYFDDVYPRQQDTINTVTTSSPPIVGEEQQDTTIYQFSSTSGLVITEDDLLSEEIFKVVFEDGKLAGREFNIIIKGENLYEIEYIQEGENYVPNPSLAPKSGDKFVFFGFNAELVMGDLTANAKEELKARAKDYLKDLGGEYIYDVKTRSIHCEINHINLELGQSVKLVSPIFGEVISRVQGYEKNLDNPYEATYIIGNSPAYSRIGSIEKTVEANKYQMTKAVGLTSEYVQYLIKTIGFESFISKLVDDVAKGLITFEQGIEIGNYDAGIIGGGASFKMLDGVSILEIDQLTVRQRAVFNEVFIKRSEHIGGDLIISNANMICKGVVEQQNGYKCYFNNDNDTIPNTFKVGDLARSQIFKWNSQSSSLEIVFYWREVREVGLDFVTLSKLSGGYAVGSSTPKSGDHIFQLGNKTDIERQSAQIFSAFGSDAPSWKQYNGIDGFTLEGKMTTAFTSKGNTIDGATTFINKVKNGVSSSVPFDEYIEIRTPTIVNGYWWIDGENTHVRAVGEDGTSVTIKGSVASKSNLPAVGEEVGDGYLTNDDGHLHVWDGANWNDVGQIKGNDGIDGVDGNTPVIGSNGNWYIGGVDTHIKAKGIDGIDGGNGETPHIGSNGNWYIGTTDTGIKAEGVDGRGLLNATIQYANSTSFETPPLQGSAFWKDAPYEKGANEYTWIRTKLVWSDNDITYTGVQLWVSQAEINKIKAITDEIGTIIDGALVSTVLLYLRGLNSPNETAGISGIVGDGYLPSYWSGGTYQEAVNFGLTYKELESGGNITQRDMAQIVFLHNGISKYGNLIINSDGDIFSVNWTTGERNFVISSESGSASLKNALITGALKTPFQDGYFRLTEHGSPITVSTNGLQNNNCVVITGTSSSWANAFVVPFTPEYNGFRATVINTDWGGKISNGMIEASAPSELYFQERGEYLDKLQIGAYEGVEMIGVGKDGVFYGWLILNRFRFGKDKVGTGYNSTVLFEGEVQATSSGASIVKQKSFDGSKCSITKGYSYLTLELPTGSFTTSNNHVVQLMLKNGGAGITINYSSPSANSIRIMCQEAYVDYDKLKYNNVFKSFNFRIMTSHTWT